MLSDIASLGTHLLGLRWNGLAQAPIQHSLTSDPTALIDSGTIVGLSTSVPSSDVVVNKFLGIPYGVPPLGDLRFLPPNSPPVHDSPLEVKAFKPACMPKYEYPRSSPDSARQRQFVISVFGGQPTPQESEDCLYLNVYTPDTSTPNKAVMFWIFGGGMKFGHAGQDLLDGTSLAANQDVVVVTINYRTNVFGFSNSPAVPFLSHNAAFYDQRLALDWVQRNIAAFGGDPDKVTILGQSAGGKSSDRLVLSPPSPPGFRAAILQSGVAAYDGDVLNSTTSWEALVGELGCGSTDASAKDEQELVCVRTKDASTIKGIIEQKDLFFSQSMDSVTKFEPQSTALRTRKYPLWLAPLVKRAEYSRLDVQSIVWSRPANLEYYFNARFPSTNPSAALDALGYPGTDLEAFHSSDVAYVFGTLPANATDEQIKLSKYMQTAWANFAKDPTSGPGWQESKQGVMVLGGPNTANRTFEDPNAEADSAKQPGSQKAPAPFPRAIDARCRLWQNHLLGSG